MGSSVGCLWTSRGPLLQELIIVLLDAVLLYGTFTFNGIIPPPKFLAPRVAGEQVEADKRPLLAEEEEAERR